MLESLAIHLTGQTSSDSFMIELVKWLNPILEPVVIVVLLLLLAMSAGCWPESAPERLLTSKTIRQMMTTWLLMTQLLARGVDKGSVLSVSAVLTVVLSVQRLFGQMCVPGPRAIPRLSSPGRRPVQPA